MTTNRIRTNRGMRRHKPSPSFLINQIFREHLMPELIDMLYRESPMMRALRERQLPRGPVWRKPSVPGRWDR